MPQFFDQLQEVGDVTYSGVGVSRDGGEHQYLNCQPARRQDQANSVRSNENFRYGLLFSSSSFTFSGQTECSNPGCGPSSSLLSLPFNRTSSQHWHMATRTMRPCCPCHAKPRRNLCGGRRISPSGMASHSDRNQARWSSSQMPPSQAGEQYAEGHAREVLGQLRSRPCISIAWNSWHSEDIHEGCLRDLSAPPVGQCHSRGIYQQPGGHSVESTDGTSERNLVMGPEQRHFPESPTYPRGV